MFSRDQFVGDDAPRIDVRPLVGCRIAGRLLRRHVHRSSEIVAGLRYLGRRLLSRCLNRLRDTEIRDDSGALAEQNVLGLDVAVDDALLVRVGESGRDIAQYRQAFLERNATLSDAIAQRLSAHEGHRIEWKPARRLTRGEYGQDVRFLERGREFDLPRESRC